MDYHCREIKVSDAGEWIALQCRLDEETSFMLFEPGERERNKGVEEKRIKEILNDPFKKFLVIESDGRLVGFIAVLGSELKRIRHRASVVIGILLEFSGHGLGKMLFKQAEEWARDNGITRLELTVMTHNRRALWLYSSTGFNVEGIRRKAMKVDGKDIDEFYMSKILK